MAVELDGLEGGGVCHCEYVFGGELGESWKVSVGGLEMEG